MKNISKRQAVDINDQQCGSSIAEENYGDDDYDDDVYAAETALYEGAMEYDVCSLATQAASTLEELAGSSNVSANSKRLEFPSNRDRLRFYEKLNELLDWELNDKIMKSNHIERLLANSKLPDLKKTPQQEFLKRCNQTSWLQTSSAVLLCEEDEFASSELAVLLGYHACREEKKVGYYIIDQLVSKIRKESENRRLAKMRRELLSKNVLILDRFDWSINYGSKELDLVFGLLKEDDSPRSIVVSFVSNDRTKANGDTLATIMSLCRSAGKVILSGFGSGFENECDTLELETIPTLKMLKGDDHGKSTL